MRFYNANPDGYCGDEDNGQTSAWYVFSALGFYPVCPGSGEYALGTPYFRKATITLPAGKTLTIEATPVTVPASPVSVSPITVPEGSPVTVPEGSPEGSLPPFIQRMTVDGQPYTRNYLRHDDLLRGGTIRFDLGAQPNRSRGTADTDVPYSFSKE